MQRASRESDERILKMIRLRIAGIGTPTIARRLGLAQGVVVNATGAVLAADLAESGDAPAVVRAAYGWKTMGKN